MGNIYLYLYAGLAVLWTSSKGKKYLLQSAATYHEYCQLSLAVYLSGFVSDTHSRLPRDQNVSSKVMEIRGASKLRMFILQLQCYELQTDLPI